MADVPDSETLVTKINDIVNAKRLKKRLKAKKIDMEGKNLANKSMQQHNAYLVSNGWFDKDNFKDVMHPIPSYYLIHSLVEGLSVVGSSCLHIVDMMNNITIHNHNQVRLQLPNWMCLF